MIVDLMYRGGLNFMRFSVSDPPYGDFVSGPRIIDGRVRQTSERVLADIQDGSFAARWIAENRAAATSSSAFGPGPRPPVERVGADLRAAMPFLNPVIVQAGQAQAAAGGSKGSSH